MADAPAKPTAAPLSGLSPVKLAVLAQRARAQSEAMLRADPIAIVGMACRFPGGADTPARFWQLLVEGRDAIGPVPPQRWDVDESFDADPAVPGKSMVREGGFIGAVDGFDAEFFGILPREVEKMDPQQRLFLEVATEALDDAGLARERLAGSRTGVFAASYHSDYAQLQYRDALDIDARTLTGTVHSVVSNRLSYLLDLRGPSITVDTACSSSLVALHLACQALRYGECDVSITGGVSLMLTPGLMVSLSKVGFMAPDGRCKTFDDSADGFGRGEGCGVIVLKRLADAIADGDRVLALVRGSAVNQDGHSTVLAAPNGLAQQEVIRQALDNAQVPAQSVGYVEAHGTGTPLGDPIEVEALGATIGQPAAGAGPCYVGAAKANIGHMEAAAGIGGVIKSILMFQHGMVPPQPHLRNINQHIRLAGTRLRISATAVPWPRGPQPRRIGTSGFGVGGTNAHVLLEEAPQLPSAPAVSQRPGMQLLPLSAQGEPALRALAGAWIELLRNSPASAAAICAAASERRSHLDHRLAVTGASTLQLSERLRDYLDGRPGAQLAGGRAQARRRLAFVFSGQGPQWFGMGRQLLVEEPVFRDQLQQVDALLAPLSGWSLLEILAADEASSRLGETQCAQPALFGIQVALVALWKSWGIEPDGVVGHSIGELAALHVAGVLALPEAVRIVWLRARAMQRATGMGAMAAIALDEPAAAELVAAQGDELSIGAVNSPRGVVLSGKATALDAVLATLAARGVAVQRLAVQYAFHSAQMQPLAAEFGAALGSVAAGMPTLPFYSTVTGGAVAAAFDAGYFARNVRQPVRFAAAIDAMLDDGFDAFLEIGPHPVLGMSIAECAAGREVAPLLLASLRRRLPEREALLQTCAALYAAQRMPAWRAINPARPADDALPNYPWQRRRYWLRTPPQLQLAAREPASGCLGQRVPAAAASIFESSWPGHAPDWLADHRVGGTLLMPAAAMLEALRQAAGDALGQQDVMLSDFTVHRPLALAAETLTRWQVSASRAGDGFLHAQLHELQPEGVGAQAWRLVASAMAKAAGAQHSHGNPVAPLVRAFDAAAAADFYSAFDAVGVQFGPAFRTVRGITINGSSARVALEPRALAGAGLHPALLDGALQACIAVAAGDGQRVSQLLLPLGVDRYEVHGPVPVRMQAQVAWRREGAGGSITVDARLCDEDGRVVALAEGVRLVPVSMDSLLQLGADDWLYDVAWEPVSRAGPRLSAAAWIIVPDAQGVGEALAAQLRDAGAACASLPLENLAALDGLLADAQWRRGLPLAGVLLLSGLDVPAADAVAHAINHARTDSLTSLAALQAYQALARADAADLQLVLITSGAQPAGSGVPRPAAATLWGMQAAIAAEHPDFHCRVVDLDADAAIDIASLVAEITQGGDARRIVLRGAQRLQPRLRRLPAPGRHAPVRFLQRDGSGLLDSLAWQPLQLPPPARGEVRLQVLAAGLNFRDVMLALGMYPGDSALPLGAECAGIVQSLGEGVTRFTPGDVVFGFAPRSLASEVNVAAAFLAPLPDGLTAEQAAALPVAFLTAMYGLQRVAGLRAGMGVLIHAAAGGVGMAAVQLALRAGATVFATAGSPAKRALLQAMGVQHVFDSRSLDFAAQIAVLTAGHGVDVVLNSLAGEFIAASVDALASDGCFLELGKRDLWSPAQFAAVRPRARYVVYDLGAEALADATLLPPMLAELTASLAAATLRPLPVRVFDFDAAQDAFRFMAQARHVGKLVLRAAAATDDMPAPPVRADSTYLITGGLGAIGRQTARWLVERGARHLMLVARRLPDAAATAELQHCRQLGADVQVRQVDVGDFTAMQGLLQQIAATMPPLRGIVHAAGSIDDGVLLQQDAARFAQVLRGKSHGARNLHALTARAPLDFFILYSAAGLLLGPAGQGAYAAANAELDALAWSRRAAGLPATSVAWGMWRDGGMAAGMAARGLDTWSARGLGWISPEQGFARLGRLLAWGVPHAAVLPIDWSRFLASSGSADRGWFAGLGSPAHKVAAATANATPTNHVQQDWRLAPQGQRRALVIAHLREQALQVLGLDAATALDAHMPLKEAGLDSLMAVELRNALTRSVGRSLPATLLFDYPTLEKLADYLFRVLELEAPAATAAAKPAAAGIASMSEEEAEAQLLAELSGGAVRSADEPG